jgi:predicted Zn-ribbon and HTH transcriptional regulator
MAKLCLTQEQVDRLMKKVDDSKLTEELLSIKNIMKMLGENVTHNKVICDRCGWSWDKKDGGDDLYTCHKCGYDNTPN